MSEVRALALEVFEAVRAAFPDLEIRIDREPEQVDLALDAPVQPGLEHVLHLNLQNDDELHLCWGEDFWMSWFPATDPEVREAFQEAATELLKGRFRVLVYETARGRYRKGHLQRPAGNEWETIARDHGRFSLPWARVHNRVLRNRP